MTSTGEEGGWFREMFAVDGVTPEGERQNRIGDLFTSGQAGAQQCCAPTRKWGGRRRRGGHEAGWRDGVPTASGM